MIYFTMFTYKSEAKINLPCDCTTVDPALIWGSLNNLSFAVSLRLEVLVHLQPLDRSGGSGMRNTLNIIKLLVKGLAIP